jgi:hypothetical protein
MVSFAEGAVTVICAEALNVPVKRRTVNDKCRCAGNMMSVLLDGAAARDETLIRELSVLSDESQEEATALYERFPDSAFKDASHLTVYPLQALLHAAHAGLQASDLNGLVFIGCSRTLSGYQREFFDGCGELGVQLLLRGDRGCDVLS